MQQLSCIKKKHKMMYMKSFLGVVGHREGKGGGEVV